MSHYFMAILGTSLLAGYLLLDLYLDLTNKLPTLTHLVRQWGRDYTPLPQVIYAAGAVLLFWHFFLKTP